MYNCVKAQTVKKVNEPIFYNSARSSFKYEQVCFIGWTKSLRGKFTIVFTWIIIFLHQHKCVFSSVNVLPSAPKSRSVFFQAHIQYMYVYVYIIFLFNYWIK